MRTYNNSVAYALSGTISTPGSWELTDMPAEWFGLRFTQMAGYDYIFVPQELCGAFDSLYVLQEFTCNTQAVLGSEPHRTVLIGYTLSADRNARFERFDIDWADEVPIACCHSVLDTTSPHRDFIETLFDHSESLAI